MLELRRWDRRTESVFSSNSYLVEFQKLKIDEYLFMESANTNVT